MAGWSNGKVVGLRVRGFFPQGFDPWTRNEKYLWDALVSPTQSRRSEVGGKSLKYGGLLIKSAASRYQMPIGERLMENVEVDLVTRI